MPKTVKSRRNKNIDFMKKLLLISGILQSLLFFAASGQPVPESDQPVSGFSATLRGGYDGLPFYNNNTPFIDYKGGLAGGLSANYYWDWIGLGADVDYIRNQPKSTYTYTGSAATQLTAEKITRMFYGLGPSFKYQRDSRFSAELLLRGGLATVRGGLTDLSTLAPPAVLNYHAGYDAKSVVSAKAQAQVNYYFSSWIGAHAGVYYLHHFKTPELIGSQGYAAAYLHAATADAPAALATRTHPCNCDIASIGAFAGLSLRVPQKKKTVATPVSYGLAITARDQYTREPLPNTEVVVRNAYGEVVYSGTTNHYGVVVFNNVQASNYAIAGKLYGVDLSAATAVQTEFRANETLQKEILYTDQQFILRGKVVECNVSNALGGASVVLTNEAAAEQKHTNTDDKGEFVFHALQQATYAIYAKKNDYFSQTERIETKDFDRNKTLFIKLEVCMEKADCGKAIVLKNIYYDLDQYFIRASAQPELNKLAQFMKDNPGVKVELSSHTDSRASDRYNMTLSQNRANAAVDYLVSQGISKERLIPVGYGERRLLNACADGVACSEAAHQLNRRTEMKVICPDRL